MSYGKGSSAGDSWNLSWRLEFCSHGAITSRHQVSTPSTSCREKTRKNRDGEMISFNNSIKCYQKKSTKSKPKQKFDDNGFPWKPANQIMKWLLHEHGGKREKFHSLCAATERVLECWSFEKKQKGMLNKRKFVLIAVLDFCFSILLIFITFSQDCIAAVGEEGYFIEKFNNSKY